MCKLYVVCKYQGTCFSKWDAYHRFSLYDTRVVAPISQVLKQLVIRIKQTAFCEKKKDFGMNVFHVYMHESLNELKNYCCANTYSEIFRDKLERLGRKGNIQVKLLLT